MSATQITVRATIAATAEKAWECYTLPEHIMRWNFASPDWHCPAAENDLRPGGRYSARMEARDGSFGFDFAFVYDEVRHPEHIAYTMEDGRRATVDFIPGPTGTEVIVTFDAETMNPVELQQQGWQAILDNFKVHTENC